MPEESMFTDGRTTKTASVSDGESDSGVSSQSDSRHEFPPEIEYRLNCSSRSVLLPDWVNQQRPPSYSHGVPEYSGQCKDHEGVLKREVVGGSNSFGISRNKTRKFSSDGHLYSDNENRKFSDSLYRKQSDRNEIMKYVNPIYDKDDHDDDDCFAIDLRLGHYCCAMNNSEMYTKEIYVDTFSHKHGCRDKSHERKCSLEREENKTEVHCSWKSGYLLDEKPIDYSQLSSRSKDTCDGDRKVALLHPSEDSRENLSKKTAKCLPEATTNISRALTRPTVLTTKEGVMLLPKINGLPESSTNISKTKISSTHLATNVETILSSQNNDFPRAAVNISNTITGSPVLPTNVEIVLSPKINGIPSSQRRAVLSGKTTRNFDQISSHDFVSQNSSKLENYGFPRSAPAASNVSPHTHTAQEINKPDILVTKSKISVYEARTIFKKAPNIYHPKLKYLTTVSRLQAKDYQPGKEYVPSTENEKDGDSFCKKETFTSHDNHQTEIRAPLNNCNIDNFSKTVSYKNIQNIMETNTMPAQDCVSADSIYRSPLKFTKGEEQETTDPNQTNVISSPIRRISILHNVHRSLNKFPNPEYPKQVAINSSNQSPKPNSLPQNIPASEEMQASANTKSYVEKHACVDCSKRYSSASNLARHRQIHQQVYDKQVRECPYCEKTYVSTAAYTMHARTHIPGSECPFCGKHFSRPWLLQGHIRTHTGEKPFPCPQCGRPFADKSNLRAHIQTHAAEKPYVCSRCRKAFALKSYLYKHESSSCMKNHRSKVTD